MSRKTKYRAWDKTIEKMIDVTDLNLKSGYLIGLVGSGYVSCKFENAELLQFTGLKDKNGVEIYEGDIVKVSDGVFHYMTNVVWYGDETDWNYPAFDLNGDHVPSGWVYESNALQAEYLNGNLQVVGNIYDNPELLEDKL